MSSPSSALSELARKVRQLSSRSLAREQAAEEARLYYRRACLAAGEERYDVALVFCGKALAIDSRHLATRLLVAQIYDRGLNDFEEALAGYRKVIVLGGYDSANPYCAAAREALDAMVSSSRLSAFSSRQAEAESGLWA